MFESIMKFLKKWNKKEKGSSGNSKDAAKERLHLVLMQDRANVSVDFLELMKQEIIDVIKKYIDIDESAIDVRLTNKENEDGTNGAPALYANIPIVNIKNEARKIETKQKKEKIEKKENEEKDSKKASEELENKKVEENKEEEKHKKENNKNEENKEEEKQKKENNKNEEKNKEEETNKEIENNTKEEKSNENKKTKEDVKSEN